MIWIFVRDCYGKCPRKLNFNSWKDWNLGKTQENDNHFKIFFRRLSKFRTRLKIVAIISRHFRAWKALEDTIGRFYRKWPYGVGTDVHGDFLFVHVTSIFLIFDFLFFWYLARFHWDVTRVSSCSWARKLMSRIIVPMAESIRGLLSHDWEKDFPKICQFFKNNECDTCEIRTHAGIAHGLSRAAP